LPDALAAPGAFVDASVRLARSVRANVILPVSEAALLAILPERDRYKCAVVPFVDADRFSAICDKAMVLKLASGHGIAVPRQWKIGTPDDARSMVGSLPFPLVVKPARSV